MSLRRGHYQGVEVAACHKPCLTLRFFCRRSCHFVRGFCAAVGRRPPPPAVAHLCWPNAAPHYDQFDVALVRCPTRSVSTNYRSRSPRANLPCGRHFFGQAVFASVFASAIICRGSDPRPRFPPGRCCHRLRNPAKLRRNRVATDATSSHTPAALSVSCRPSSLRARRYCAATARRPHRRSRRGSARAAP